MKNKNHPALDALTRGAVKTGNLNLRPLSLGSYSLCCRAGLQIATGAKPSGKQDADGKPIPSAADNERLPFELAAFAFIHAADTEKVLDALDGGEKAFRRAVDAYALGLTMQDFSELVAIVPEMVKDAFSALVVPASKDAEGDAGFESKNGRGRRE